MPDSSSEDLPPPHTPPPRNFNRPHNYGDTASSLSPQPQPSPSMSLYSLGMSPFSPLRRQFSTPRMRSSESPRPETAGSEHHERAEDSKDVLIQRLNDLVVKLSAEGEVREDSVDSLHAKVDEMELALSRSSGTKSRRHRHNASSLDIQEGDPDHFERPSTPTWLRSQISEMSSPVAPPDSPALPPVESAPQLPVSEQPEQPEPLVIRPQDAGKVLAEAQKLHGALEAIASSLKARQEEQEHIHDLLITRAERAAQRIIYLEGRVKELENERNEGEMEILNLQIQLKAIEVQCLSYVPKDADPELLDSIETWKSEWSALKRKRARKKGDELARTPESPSPRTPRYSVTRSQTMG